VASSLQNVTHEEFGDSNQRQGSKNVDQNWLAAAKDSADRFNNNLDIPCGAA
jgi:hypothetical protein